MFFFQISQNLDKVMIGIFFSMAEVGYYYTVGKIYVVLNTLSAAVAMLLFPAMSEAHAENNLERISNLSQKAERSLSIIFVPITSVVIAFADPVIFFLLGDTFLPAVPLLRVFAVTVLLYSLSRPYNIIIPATNRPGIMATLSIISVVIAIILNLILIPKELFGVTLFGLGALGAAIGSFLATFIMLVPTRIYIHKVLGFKAYNIRVILHIFAGLVMMTFLHYSGAIVPIYQLPYFIGLVFVGFGVYTVVLVIFNELRKEDIVFFIDTINPQKMKAYFFEEIKK